MNDCCKKALEDLRKIAAKRNLTVSGATCPTCGAAFRDVRNSGGDGTGVVRK
jgi:hypothetical protein